MKPHILIVEDESILYERLRKALVLQRFTVDDYTPSYNMAIERINNNAPDLVLLDINLSGRKDGLDLGKVLDSKYNIPFIYVTELDDDTTFQQGLHTNHEQYIVKTKPHLEIKEVVRNIHTVLHKREQQNLGLTKDGIMGLTGYLDDIREYSYREISKVPILFNEIVFFTLKPFVNDQGQEEKLRDNYLWFSTKSKERYFLKSSLKSILGLLPKYFVRINENQIINLSQPSFDGQINGSRLSIGRQEFVINARFSKQVKKRINELYH